MPLTIPSIDMIEIGAGGGSIASIDDLGLLKVGPRSAGSEPGPACYGRGGTEPTVTDADLLLGLLDADNFLGGDMQLDRPAAEAAMARLARRRWATGVDQTAGGVYRDRRRDHGRRRPRPRHRSRRRPSRPAAARLRRRRAGARLRGRRAAGKHGGDLPAAGQRAVGLRHAGDAGAARPGAQRAGRAGRSSTGTRSTACWTRWPPRASPPWPTRAARPRPMRLSIGADLRYFGQQNEVGVTLRPRPAPAPRRRGDPRARSRPSIWRSTA